MAHGRFPPDDGRRSGLVISDCKCSFHLRNLNWSREPLIAFELAEKLLRDLSYSRVSG